jgi:hypothetical protein
LYWYSSQPLKKVGLSTNNGKLIKTKIKSITKINSLQNEIINFETRIKKNKSDYQINILKTDEDFILELKNKNLWLNNNWSEWLKNKEDYKWNLDHYGTLENYTNYINAENKKFLNREKLIQLDKKLETIKETKKLIIKNNKKINKLCINH